MQDYNLVQKKNPLKPDEAKKWYAVPQSGWHKTRER